MIWLFGDSIFRGLALGRFPDVFTPEEAAAEPLWAFRSPASMINLMIGAELAELAGVTGLPDPGIIAHGVKKLRFRLDTGRIQAGDQLAFLDVGLHAEDPETHRDQWLQFRRAATEAHDVHMLICTGFDGFPARNGKKFFSGVPWTRYAHDQAFNGALVEAAETLGEFVGRTSIVDLGASMRAFEAVAAGLGASAFQNDGIHLNVWGQLHLSAELCRAALPYTALHTQEVTALIERTWPAVADSSPIPDLAAALALARAALETETSSS